MQTAADYAEEIERLHLAAYYDDTGKTWVEMARLEDLRLAAVRAERAAKIVTDFIYPPIPDRRFDWCACIDGEEEGLCGYGRTEAEAIAELQDLIDDRDDA